MSFEESIIIPLEDYKRCQFNPQNDVINILMDKTLPADKKMKLFHQQQTRNKYNKKSSKQTVSGSDRLPTNLPFGEHILHNLPLKDKPHARALLEVFHDNPSELNWNDRQEVIVDQKVIHDSNIVNIFRYFTKNLVLTRSDDLPPGTRDVYSKLMDLDVPSSWIKQKPKKVQQVRAKRLPHRKQFDSDEGSATNDDPGQTRKRKRQPRKGDIDEAFASTTWTAY